MFHSPFFIEKIRKTPGCQYVEVDAGHWLQLDQPELFQREVILFLELQ